MKIDGKQIANKIFEDLRTKVFELKKEDIVPHLAIILVGDDPASVAYIEQKELKAEDIGIQTTLYNLDFETQNSDLVKLIDKLNKDQTVHGIIVQRPLPKQINSEEIAKAIDPKKDVDGFNPNSKFEMPISLAVFKILDEIGIKKTDLKSKKIVIIGKGEAGGKPITAALQKMGIEPTIIDSKTENPSRSTKTADIIISAVGKANTLKPAMIKHGVILIGIGITRGESAKLMGDYDRNKIKDIASFYTPTPGGVGPVNVAMLLENLISSAKSQE